MKVSEMDIAPGEGILYLCATPIGNMEDVTLRTLNCLKQADYIAVENIKRSNKLLRYYGLKKTLISYREENRDKKSREILTRIKQGAVIALITDAGMPAISDPGSNLLKMMVEEGLPFSVLPGPSAAFTALLLSGYSTQRFVFWGFLSRKKKKRLEELEVLSREEKTVILYESPHRLVKTLEDMTQALDERELAVCREMTKKFEEVKRGKPHHLTEHFYSYPPRGELTLVLSPLSDGVEGAEGLAREDTKLHRDEIKKMLHEEMEKGSTSREAIKKVQEDSGLSKNKVYDIFIELKEKNSL